MHLLLARWVEDYVLEGPGQELGDMEQETRETIGLCERVDYERVLLLSEYSSMLLLAG